MKILVTARYIRQDSTGGGSGRFMRCMADTLRELGHDVTVTEHPGEYFCEPFDLILCSHPERFAAIKNNKSRKVFIAHGLIPDEHMVAGADRYVSVSEEVRGENLETRGIDSVVIGQPIVIPEQKPPREELRRILVIRREPVPSDPFAFLAGSYELRISDPAAPIEGQIEWADLVIAIGRGALEAMAQGKPVLVADNRPYIGALGDGYVTPENILEIARHNFSGRRFRHPLTREWIEAELARYDFGDSGFLYRYVRDNHNARIIVGRYLDTGPVIAFGVMVNDLMRLDMCFRQSEIDGKAHIVKEPEFAAKGLNKLLDIARAQGADVAVLAHQDMHFRQGWLPQVKEQLALLPDSWVVAGIIGKDLEGNICGKFHDMRIAPVFNTSDIHTFPQPAACFDECCIIVNLKKKFRFDERLEGFDLYGTMAVLQAWEMGGTAWIIDAFAEHYCMRPFTWFPDEDFQTRFKWLHERFPNALKIDSTVLGVPKENKKAA